MNSKLVGTAIAAGMAFAVYKFSHNPMVKTAALGVLGTVIVKALPIPYLNAALA